VASTAYVAATAVICGDVSIGPNTCVGFGAELGERAEVRVNGTVHLLTRLPQDALVPIGWVAVGQPAQILPPARHDDVWAIQEPLKFPRVAYDVDRPLPGGTNMPQITQQLARSLQRHRQDRIL
jgi:carbonic anhydrase/acetyltransferase-like protein (isoleucine patch superfamily)